MKSRRRLASVLAIAALVLGACGGSDGAESSPTADSAPVETDPVPVETDPVPVETDPVPVETDPVPVETDPVPVETDPVPVETDPVPVETDPPPSTNAPDDGSDGSCLIGEWVITQEEMNQYYDVLTAGFGDGAAAVDIDIVGQTLLTFTQTEYVYTAEFDLTLAVAGTSNTGVSTGTVSGTWEAVDGVVVTTLGESDLNVIVEVGGQTIDGSDLADGFLTSSPINEAPFDCAGPTLGFQADSTGAVRHDVTLTPA